MQLSVVARALRASPDPSFGLAPPGQRWVLVPALSQWMRMLESEPKATRRERQRAAQRAPKAGSSRKHARSSSVDSEEQLLRDALRRLLTTAETETRRLCCKNAKALCPGIEEARAPRDAEGASPRCPTSRRHHLVVVGQRHDEHTR